MEDKKLRIKHRLASVTISEMDFQGDIEIDMNEEDGSVGMCAYLSKEDTKKIINFLLNEITK
tara:strand:- start:1360 stop:1545 length:186 start_codon:yes stop_codon:yes gene_type:complete